MLPLIETTLNMFMRFSFFNVILLLCINESNEQQYVTRTTSNGDVRGYTVLLNPTDVEDNRQLDSFVGIPFARPPIGELRWQLPQKPDPWEEARDATSFSPCCSQDIQYIQAWSFGPEFNNTDEDCLYLNVFAPRQQDVELPTATYPVMVWIHGGSNRYGCGEEYDSRIIPRYDVVVVTLNYRLGILGYLTTDDDVAPGNYGLHDQILALQWVQENIAYFGGDPAQVTIFGNSAGGANVALHLFSALTDGLFSRVIEQSGTATTPWALYRPPLSSRPSTVYLAEEFGCPTSSSQAMIDCLLLQDAEELVYTYVPSPSDAHSAWAPRVDGYYIVDSPENLMLEGQFLYTDLLSGTVPNEVSLEYPYEEEGWTREKKEEEMYLRSRRYADAGDRVYDAMVQQYDKPGENPQEQRDIFLDLRADNEYIAGHDLHVQGHSNYAPGSFLYNFAYRALNHTIPLWMGVPHFEECYYVFGVPVWNSASDCPWGCNNINWYPWVNWNEDDIATSYKIMQAWTNFAKTGIPSTNDFDWPAFDYENQFYVELNTSWSSKQYYKYSGASFNNIYLPKMLNDSTDCSAGI